MHTKTLIDIFNSLTHDKVRYWMCRNIAFYSSGMAGRYLYIHFVPYLTIRIGYNDHYGFHLDTARSNKLHRKHFVQHFYTRRFGSS